MLNVMTINKWMFRFDDGCPRTSNQQLGRFGNIRNISKSFYVTIHLYPQTTMILSCLSLLFNQRLVINIRFFFCKTDFLFRQTNLFNSSNTYWKVQKYSSFLHAFANIDRIYIYNLNGFSCSAIKVITNILHKYLL